MMIMLPVERSDGPISRTLHLIWVGGKAPDYVSATMAIWATVLSKGWTIKYWTDESVVGTPMANLIDVGKRYGLPPRGVADLIRVMAVSLYGGIYCDVDAVPLKPMNSWAGKRKAWLGSSPRTKSSLTIANATFGFPRGHPFLARVWEYASVALERGVTNEHFVAGPRVFRRVWEEDPDAVEVCWDFDTEWTPDLQKMVRSGAIDLDILRMRFPSAPVLNVVLR